MKVLMIDNFDSFTYNLVQYLRELGAEVQVVRNDTRVPVEDLLSGMDGLVVSPGPCAPGQAGISMEILRTVGSPSGPHVPALGVCLGHQALAEAQRQRPVNAALAPPPLGLVGDARATLEQLLERVRAGGPARAFTGRVDGLRRLPGRDRRGCPGPAPGVAR